MSDLGRRQDDFAELPHRRRRRWRLVTPTTLALFGVLLAALGFMGGVLVEKGSSSSSGATRAAAPGAAGFAARAGGTRFGGGGGSAPGGAGGTFGQVSSARGRTLYVATAGGNTVKVTVPKGVSVSRTQSVGAGAIHPGDTVVVQGSPGPGGAIRATAVRATAPGAGGGGAGAGGGSPLSQLFGTRAGG